MIARKALLRQVKAQGTITNGIFTEGAETQYSFTASVQPLNPAEIEQLPEGRRNKKPLWLFTSTKLNEVTSSNPDIVIIDGERYEVDKVHPWQNGILNHYKCLVMGVEIQ